MVAIPEIEKRVVTSEAPQTSLSPSTVAAPFSELAKGLNSVGEGLTDVAVVNAQQQGQKAVTRDENGQLQVALMPPMTGKAGVEFNRAAKQSYLAQLTPEIGKKMAEARVKYEGKPQEFQDFASQYVENLAGNQPPELQSAVRIMAAQHAAETYNGLVVRQGNVALKSG